MDERTARDLDGEPAPAAARQERVVVRKNSAGQTIRTVVATLLAAAVIAFMALNTDEVRVDLGFDRYDSPMWAAVGLAALAGVVVGWMLGWRRCRRPHAG